MTSLRIPRRVALASITVAALRHPAARMAASASAATFKEVTPGERSQPERGSATKVPIGDVTTSPSSRSASRTFWAVVVATSYSWLIERNDGSRSPGASSPHAMRSR